MDKWLKRIVLLYFILVLIKSILVALIPAPTAFSDEYIYFKLARSIIYEHNYSVHGIPYNTQPPLYSLLIAPAYLASNDSQIIYLAAKIINVLISTIAVFPLFLLARRFIREKQAFILTVLISLAAPLFFMPSLVMSENLFYLLVILVAYTAYRAFESDNTIWFQISGLLIGLCCLTRAMGLALIPLIGLIYLVKFMRRTQVLNIFVHYLSAIIILVPWYLLRILQATAARETASGYSKMLVKLMNIPINFISFSDWILIYISYLTVASGFCFAYFFIKGLQEESDEKLKLLLLISLATIILLVLISAIHGGSFSDPSKYDKNSILWFVKQSRLVGRYVNGVLPLIFLGGGIIFFRSRQRISLAPLFVSFGLAMAATQIKYFSLTPPNNSALSLFGILKTMLNHLFESESARTFLFLIVLLVLLALTLSAKKRSATLLIVSIFVISNSLLAYGITYANAKQWLASEQMQLGLWLNEYDQEPNKMVTFDERDCVKQIYKANMSGICEISKTSTVAGFWINKNMKITEPDLATADYVITMHKINDGRLLRETDGLYLYMKT